jgi:hypothetical protein
VLTVREESKAYEPTVLFERLVYKVGYTLWRGGIIPDGPMAYANNAPIDKDQLSDTLKQHGMFCAAVPNIYRRMAGLEVPNKGLPDFDGGIAAYFTGKFGKGYFADVDVGFNLNRAVRWAQETRAPVLLGKGYWGEDVHSQGHVALLLPSTYILQSAFGEGLHWTRTIEQERAYWSHGGVMVHPKNWIDLEGDELHRQRAEWAEKK